MKATFQLYSLFALILLLASCKENQKINENDINITSEISNTEPVERQGQAFIKDDEAKPTVLDIAIDSKDHTTLVAAVKAAELENVLVTPGPLTVFAPTNTAFNKLLEGTVEDLLKSENKAKLAFILKHHVTPGNYDKE